MKKQHLTETEITELYESIDTYSVATTTRDFEPMGIDTAYMVKYAWVSLLVASSVAAIAVIDLLILA